MKGVVLDASIAVNWYLEDEKSRTAEWVLIQMEGGCPAFVPSLWVLEITSALFNAERRKRLDRAARDAALERVERSAITILPPPGFKDLKAIRFFAERHQLTPYDAEYLRVAKENDLTLATMERNLLAAAKREKVEIAIA